MKLFRELLFDLETLRADLPNTLIGWDNKAQKQLQKAHDAGYNKAMLKVLPSGVVKANKVMVLEFERKLYNRKFNKTAYEKNLVVYAREVLALYFASHAHLNVNTETSLDTIYSLVKAAHTVHHVSELANTIKMRFEVYYNDSPVLIEHKLADLGALFRRYSYERVDTTQLDTSIQVHSLIKTPFSI